MLWYAVFETDFSSFHANHRRTLLAPAGGTSRNGPHVDQSHPGTRLSRGESKLLLRKPFALILLYSHLFISSIESQEISGNCLKSTGFPSSEFRFFVLSPQDFHHKTTAENTHLGFLHCRTPAGAKHGINNGPVRPLIERHVTAQ